MKTKKLVVLGWMTVLICAVAWCVSIYSVGPMWRNDRAPTIQQTASWTVGDLTLSVDSATSGTQLDLGYRTPTEAIAGGVFVTVLVNYSLSSDIPQSCLLYLVGKNRDWWTSFHSYGAASQIPGGSGNCSVVDKEGNLESHQGIMVAVFEIPASALDEIRGIRVSVADPRQQDVDQQSALKYPPRVAVLEFSLD
ncbi:MAG: hypothetical protein FWD55_01735 [Propionibacteriaceae bacterium]|nr:hypothetical protein [Propionibacteriaceae bacterium]